MSGSAPVEDPVEEVVLLDERGNAIGAAAKAAVHHADTPLHLAFSCYIFDAEGRLLVTQRAVSKSTFGGVWTNSCCGHPAPGEPITAAVHRRAAQELGMELRDLRLMLPRFGYRAVALDGTVEHELCPVFAASTVGDPAPDPSEVEAWEWVTWDVFRAEVLSGRRVVSQWCREQVAALPADPRQAVPADPADLPPAARLDPPSE